MSNATTETQDARDFDPYHQWLGIPPKEQPPDHYRLLGLERFESDSSVIANAADRQMAHLHQYESGEYAGYVENILSELAVARICLLDPDKKSVYDQQLPGTPDTASAGQQRKPTAQFDPYHQWLGIPFEQQPADHYRLLGLERFESDPSVIENSADRHLAYLNSHQAGEHAQQYRKILGELKAAQACLLDPKRKSAYDRQLKQRISKLARKSTPPASPRRKPNHATPPTTPQSVVAAGDLSQPENLASNVPMGPADLTQFDLANFDQPLGPGSSVQLLSSPSFASGFPNKTRSNPLLRPFIAVDNWLAQLAGPSNRGMHIAFRACAITLPSVLLLLLVLFALQSLTPSTEVADNDGMTSPNGNEIVTENDDDTGNRPEDGPDPTEKQPNEPTQQARHVDDAFTNSIGMKLVLIPAGEFMMGSPDSDPYANPDERPQYKVQITKAFYLQTTDVTQSQWEAVMGTTPWKAQRDVREGTDYPATYVSWDDAMEFCSRLSSEDGHEYRLPTEAEWEYACRAGTTTKYSFADNRSALQQYGWFSINSKDVGESYAHRVGTKRPNAWGLYDMHGNVADWCADWYDASYYGKGPDSDPQGPAAGAGRVVRGGSWFNGARDCRCAFRWKGPPDSTSEGYGFRVALAVSTTSEATPTPGTSAPVLTNSVDMKLRLIPAGEFMMGSPDSDPDAAPDEKPQHRVRITKPFYLQTTEVTQRQWEAVMGTSPWTGRSGVREGPDYAASHVTWTDATEFCRRLSAKERREYRLPTEAEWEYACRAGSTTSYSFGNSSSALQDYAWIRNNTFDIDEKYAHSVGEKRPNAWGLYDMHGNVNEWCSDRYDDKFYEQSGESDPQGSDTGPYFVRRGGSWLGYGNYSRSASRGHSARGSGGNSDGFRVVMTDVLAERSKVPKTSVGSSTLPSTVGSARFWAFMAGSLLGQDWELRHTLIRSDPNEEGYSELQRVVEASRDLLLTLLRKAGGELGLPENYWDSALTLPKETAFDKFTAEAKKIGEKLKNGANEDAYRAYSIGYNFGVCIWHLELIVELYNHGNPLAAVEAKPGVLTAIRKLKAQAQFASFPAEMVTFLTTIEMQAKNITDVDSATVCVASMRSKFTRLSGEPTYFDKP